MNREIKFRAWDGDHFEHTIYEEGKRESGFVIAHDSGCGSYFKVWQQYTGLKDKNGVEIYEGDIVRRDLDDDCGKVDMDEGVYTMSGDCQLPLWKEVDEGVEVMGNIHENPELLNQL